MKSTASKTAVRWFFAALFLAAGIAHFLRAELFVSIVPRYLPAPLALVYLSGAFEILGGLGLLLPGLRRAAGFGLIALLIAVFPANLQMAVSPDEYLAWGIPLWLLYARLPMQFVLILSLWWSIKPGDSPENA